MLIFRRARSETVRRHGSRGVDIAELRRQLSCPSINNDENRQRLLELAGRLSAVQALGGEYARVEFSEHAAAALQAVATA